MFCQRGLTGTVVAQNGYELSLLNIQRDIIHRLGDPFHIAFFVPADVFIYYIFCFYNFHNILHFLFA